MMAAVPNLLDQLRAHFDWLDQMLADGRPFLQGSFTGHADFPAYHPLWFLQRNLGSTSAACRGCWIGPSALPPSAIAGKAQ